MKKPSAGAVIVAATLAVAACGSGDDAATDSTTTTAEETTTTTEATTTTVEQTTTTTAATTTTVEETTTTEAAPEVPDPPPAGTGILTVGDQEFPFTVETCVTEPTAAEIGDSIIVFEVRGPTVAEGQPAEARLFRLVTGSNPNGNDSFGWGYATDPNDFETIVSEGSEFGIGEHIIMQETEAGLTFYGPPTPFERMEGISVVDDVDPGVGSIIATC